MFFNASKLYLEGHDLFGNTLRESEIKELCTLIYYPERKIELLNLGVKLDDWYRITLVGSVIFCVR